MKRLTLALTILSMTFGCIDFAGANPGMMPLPRPSPGGGGRPMPPRPPIYQPRYIPGGPVSSPAVVPSGTGFAIGGAPLTQGGWVGYNPTYKTYSVAFDGPGISGQGTLIQAGFSRIVAGPLTWPGAVAVMQSVGAPGW